MPKPNSVGCYGQLNSSSLHKQIRKNPLSKDACSPENHDLMPSLPETLRARHIPGCLNVMADLQSRSNQVQSTEWSLHLHVFKQIFHSSEPQTSIVCISSPRPTCLGHRWSEHKLVWSHCLCLPSHGSPSQGDLKNQAKQLPHHSNSPRLARDTVVLGPSAALNRDPTPVPSVNNTSQTVPQLCVPHQSTTSQPPRLVSRSTELQEQGFSVEEAEDCCPSKVINKDHLQVEVGSIYEMAQKKFDGLIHSLCETSIKNQEFFMYMYQDLNRHLSAIDGYRTAGHC